MITTVIIVALVVYAGATTYFINRMHNALNEADNVIDVLLMRIWYTLKAMRDLDDKHMFEEDDEVGEVFRRLADIVYEMLDVSEDTKKVVGDRLRKAIEAE